MWAFYLIPLLCNIAYTAHPGVPVFAPINGGEEAITTATQKKLSASAALDNSENFGAFPFESFPRGPNNEVFSKPLKSWSANSSRGWLKTISSIADFVFNDVRVPCFCTLCACILVVLCGILPAFLLPVDAGKSLRERGGEIKLNRLLSFGVGSLLGDVFLHLLPECWSSHLNGQNTMNCGLWIIAGLLLCFLVEKFSSQSEESQHTITAIMNLVANMVDNFTHGLAIGGSFLISIRFGCLTTFAILVHEIPHEVSDFAILLRADFNRFSAVKAQLATAAGGVLGGAVALATSANCLDQSAHWILPFTAGGFLNIALVQVLPDILREGNPRECLIQIVLIFVGILSMGLINILPL